MTSSTEISHAVRAGRIWREQVGWRIRRGSSHVLVRVVARRLLMAVPLVFVASALSFVLESLVPGDAARRLLPFDASQASYLEERHLLGLDRPWYSQYWSWLERSVHGDFGASFITKQPVSDAITQRLPVSASLIAMSLVLTLVLGVSLGFLSAVRGGSVGRLVDGIALMGFAIPAYWMGAVLISIFAVRLRWFPVTGYVPLTHSPRAWFLSLVLPVVAMSLVGIGGFAKQTRDAMLDALSSEYIRMARASGVSGASIVFRHAFKNALIRVTTLIGLLAVGLLHATVFVEYVFAIPGLGGLAVTAAQLHDLPTLQGIVVFFTLVVVAVNLLTDMAYSLIDPRVRAG